MTAAVTVTNPRSRLPLVGASPHVFGPRGKQLFGLYHPARTSRSRKAGIVLCNPLGYEAMCAYRTYRHLAEALARAGFDVLRFDYEGTGDSSGLGDEPERVRTWIDNIGTAVDELRALAGVERIALGGVRFGGTLAAIAAAARGDVDTLVLWGPCSSGRRYVHELRAFRRLKEAEGTIPAGRAEDGDEEVAGYFFDKATVSEIQGVDLLGRTERPATRALIIPRDDLPSGEQRLAAKLEANGVEVTLCPEPGYAAMMLDPQFSIVPKAAIGKIAAWLCDAYPAEPARDRAATRSTSAPGARNALNASSDALGLSVREEAVRFGANLFGIVSEPPDGSLARGRPAVVFLNVGANHRVGPNRMYVRLCRDLAGYGFLTLRFDVAGIGDSPISEGARENRLYSKDSLGDVKAAMAFLTARAAIERFVLVGLCSGAYLAFHTTVEDPRVVGQILVNPQTFEWREGDSLELSIRKSFRSTRYYLRAPFTRAAWAKTLRGRLNVRGVARELRQRFTDRTRTRLDETVARLRGREQPRSEIETAFHAVSARGVASLCIFSSNDGGLDMIEKHLGPDARRMRPRKNFHLEIVEGADHTFTPVASQRAFYRLVTTFVRERFSRL